VFLHFLGASRQSRQGSEIMLSSSGVLSIAQAPVTKQAREIPIVRRIDIPSFLLVDIPLPLRRTFSIQ